MTPAEGQVSPKLDRSSLDRRLVSSVAWTAAGKWGAQIVSSGALLVQARLLSPADFGVVSVAYLLLGFINILSEFGIGSAIVVMRELTRKQIGQTHAVAVLLGGASTLATILAAKPAAAFFRNPELVAAIPLMGLGFLLSGFRTVPQALLNRDLKFKTSSGIEAASLVFQAVAATLLAWAGLRYWALIIAALAASALRTIWLMIAAPCGLAKPVFREIRTQLVYSQRVLISRAAGYLYTNADFTIAGRMLGGSALGIYTMAWNLANAPVDRVITLVLRVTPSVFSAVQHDAAELRRYLRVVTEGMAMLVFPAGIGIALVADLAVAALLDKRWAGVAMPFRLLALAAIFNCLFSVCYQMLTAIRDVRYMMWVSLACLAAYPAAFWYGSQWGGTGIAAAWVCLVPLTGALPILRMLSKIEMPKSEYLASIRAPGIATVVMAGSVLALRYFLPPLPALAALILNSVLGAAAYAGTLLIFFRPRVDAFIKTILKRRPSTKTAAAPEGTS